MRPSYSIYILFPSAIRISLRLDNHPKFFNPSLVAARRCFRCFYQVAEPQDVTWMDALVKTRDILMYMINVPRGAMPMTERLNFERACNAAEYSFMSARDEVRACETFRRLGEHDRKNIERALFQIFPRGGRF